MMNNIFYKEALCDIPAEDVSFINSLNKEMVFKCFSFNLYKKLVSKGFYPLCKTTHSKNNTIYTTFIKTDELMKVVTEFSQDTESRRNYRIEKYGSDISYIERQKRKQEGGDR